MGNLLSGNSRSHITDADRAVLSLKAQRKKLEDQGKLLEKRIDHNVCVARELIAQQKRDRALLALKRKKLAEHQLQQLHAWLLHVENMLSNMELTKEQTKLFAALKQGTVALKAMQEELSLDDIDRLMEDTAEARDYQEQVRQALGEQLTDADDEAVLDELVMLEMELQAAEEDALPRVPRRGMEAQPGQLDEALELPPVPQGKVPTVATTETEQPKEQPLLA